MRNNKSTQFEKKESSCDNLLVSAKNNNYDYFPRVSKKEREIRTGN